MLKDEKGFTLLESLLALTIFLMIVSLFPLVMKTVQTSLLSSSTSNLESTIFFNQLAHEVKESIHLSSYDQTLKLEKGNGDVITIERISSGVIRRLRNGTGHVQMLSEVKEFKCHIVESFVDCQVKTDHLMKSRPMKPMHRLRKKERNE
ncbi:competence type IV pilus minor pilin ComGF [Bacillus solitudinis]|uniref:competence type IV pilus minor pilin ComGF n=1 Tax=Bacillus solitudinis TaxID=2014074 RepID=UPI0018E259D7|nr:competence type IV pilus minor pilin ComGF [Bacillus solitudinis]